MAQLDVTELLSDPTFVDPISIIHRTTSVDSYGQNQLVETTVNTIGSVQPASGKTLRRLPDALQLEDVSDFWVKGVVVADGASQYPDILVFQGRRYQVKVINDFSNWGAGYCEGVCVAELPSQG